MYLPHPISSTPAQIQMDLYFFSLQKKQATVLKRAEREKQKIYVLI